MTARARLTVVVGAAVAISACAQPLHDAAWDDLVTARQQDALDRGWVPEWLPEAATDLAEVDRPATGEVVLRATLPADLELEACRPQDDLPDPPTDLAAWWSPDPDGARLSCDAGWSAIRADDVVWIWSDDPDEPA